MQVAKAGGLQNRPVRFVGSTPTTCAKEYKEIDGYPEYLYQ